MPLADGDCVLMDFDLDDDVDLDDYRVLAQGFRRPDNGGPEADQRPALLSVPGVPPPPHGSDHQPTIEAWTVRGENLYLVVCGLARQVGLELEDR